MKNLKLVSHHLCPYVQRALIVLNEKEIEHERTYIDLALKPDWFLEISPLGRVPLLQTGNTILFESQVIAEYLDEITGGTLMPNEPLTKAKHRAWIEFASATLAGIATMYNAESKTVYDQSFDLLRRQFKRIEPEISLPFFDGDTFQLIDGVWGTVFRYIDVFDLIENTEIIEYGSKVSAWRDNVRQRQSVKNAAPEDYKERLVGFLAGRNSYLSTLIEKDLILDQVR